MAGRKIRANGREYTPEEFICEWCSTPLVLDTYYTIDGKNVCQSCRNKERCASCGFLITESKYVTLDDKTYHPDCFRCCECLVELPGKFHFEDNQVSLFFFFYFLLVNCFFFSNFIFFFHFSFIVVNVFY